MYARIRARPVTDCVSMFDVISQIVVYWTRYVKRIDELIREALILNCRRSLENVLELSVGDGSGPAPVILIRVSLNGNKVTAIWPIIIRIPTTISLRAGRIFVESVGNVGVFRELFCRHTNGGPISAQAERRVRTDGYRLAVVRRRHCERSDVRQTTGNVRHR